MDAFGVRFSIDDPARFEALCTLFAEVKHDKDKDTFREPEEWVRLVPDTVKRRFSWPTREQRDRWLAARDSTPIAIPPPSEQLGAEWDFYRVFEAFEDGEYDLLACKAVGTNMAEMQIEPHAYPYGGIGPLVALVEAFGFTVMGINECGKYEARQELLARRGPV